MIYIKEAHPSDGWATRSNQRQGIEVRDHRSYEEREDVANQACSIMRISMPVLIDTMDDIVNKAYAASPDRIYVVDKQGKIAVKGDRGPRGLRPSIADTRDWLAQNTPPIGTGK